MIVITIKLEAVRLTEERFVNQQLVIYNCKLFANLLRNLEAIALGSKQRTSFSRSIHVIYLSLRENLLDILIEMVIRFLATKGYPLNHRIRLFKRKKQTIEGWSSRNVSNLILSNLLIHITSLHIENIYKCVLIFKCLEKHLKSSHVSRIVSVCPNLTFIPIS